MKRFGAIAAAAAVMGLCVASRAAVITFDDGLVSLGSTLSTQYQALYGVTFAPGLGGATGVPTADPTLGLGAFATNTGMTLVSSTGSDVGGGTGAPASGLLLRSFNSDWLNEDGDPVFYITFAQPISSITITFAGVFDLTSTRIYGVNASNAAVDGVAASATGTTNLTLNLSTPLSKIVVTPGDFNDWVGVDNVNFTTAVVPEPASMSLIGLAAAGLMGRRRRA